MLVVLADDFSGASEIAGIGYRYGLTAEVQLKFNPRSEADLIVIDADTRSLTKQAAIDKTESIATQLKNSGSQVAFKKVDSIFRGHIVAEVNALQKHFKYDKVLLLPANPARGRKIISGRYFVKDIALDQTVFAKDPHFPTRTSLIEKIVHETSSKFLHTHVTPGSHLPTHALITGDVASKEDIKDYVKSAGTGDLCCGAAECFEVFLEHREVMIKTKEPCDSTNLHWPEFTLIICGSTVKEQFEKGALEKLNIPTLSLPGQWRGEQFIMEKEKEEEWLAEVSNLLFQHKLLVLSIDHEVKQVDSVADVFSKFFIRLMIYISKTIQNVHFALTGGATASAILRNKEIDRLKVKKEIAPGIVTLVNEREQALFTVKPGSYLWPSFFVESLINQNK